MAVFRSRNEILVSLSVALLIGTAVYFRLWSIDYSVSSDDTELLRRQFDLAHREALDESAEWRLRFDVEAEKALRCSNELNQLKEFSKNNDGSISDVHQKLEKLKKENLELLNQIDVLKQELLAEKPKCIS